MVFGVMARVMARVKYQAQPAQYKLLGTDLCAIIILVIHNELSYAPNCACALPSTLPFHYVIARNAPAMHLALHSKSSTLYGRSNGRKFKFYSATWVTTISYSYGQCCARCELRYYLPIACKWLQLDWHPKQNPVAKY